MIKKSRKSHIFDNCSYIINGGRRMTTHGIDVSQYQGLIDWEIVQKIERFCIF